jgi:hypothetical protein
MATLIQWGNSEGIKGRCDAKCHNAKRPECECICGGRYHGCAQGGTQPETIVDAELLLMGEDPQEVDPELKRAVTERVLAQLSDHFERFKRAQDARLRCRWTGKGSSSRVQAQDRAGTGKQLVLPLWP